MGLKRKASGDDPTQASSSSVSEIPDLSQVSTISADSRSGEQFYNMSNIAGAPYFNSRTRKRFRNGRPDEDTVHHNTLKKLFNAQKGQDDIQTSTRNIYPNSRDTSTIERIQGPSVQVNIPPDRAQRSLDAFFGSRPATQTPEPHQVQVGPLTASLYQPQEVVPHRVPPHPRTLPSILTCEDCAAFLLTKTTGEAIDAEMLDVGSSHLGDPEVEEGWTCALCYKMVCDTCAVRGDYRVCLECAVPGGGKYRPEELREKRWVGGIGWM